MDTTILPRTHLARHHRSKEEATAEAEGVDLVGDGLDVLPEISRPPDLQLSAGI